MQRPKRIYRQPSVTWLLAHAPNAEECTALLLQAKGKFLHASDDTRRKWQRAHDKRLAELQEKS